MNQKWKGVDARPITLRSRIGQNIKLKKIKTSINQLSNTLNASIIKYLLALPLRIRWA